MDLSPLIEWWRAFLRSPDMWSQTWVVGFGAIATWLLGRYLRSRLEPMIAQPGLIIGVGRTAVRTTALALIPALFWTWLFAANSYFRRHDMDTDFLRPVMLLVGAAALVRASVFVLRHSFSPGSKLKKWEDVLTITIWTIIALHILGWLPTVTELLNEYALEFGNIRISLYNVVSFALLTALFLLAALWISNALRGRIARSAALDESMKFALSRLSTVALAAVAVLASMVAAGIDLTAFAVFGGALGVGLGLGMQRIVSNFVSGFILAFEGSVGVGDRISLNGEKGRITSLHARYMVVHTDDGMDIVVPNENLLTSEVINWSYEGDARVRMTLPLQIAYRDDPDKVIALLERLAREHPKTLDEPPPEAIVTGFGDNGIYLELKAWVEDTGMGGVRSDLCRRIWQEFARAGIRFPFPQREVRIADPGISPAKRE